MSSSSGGSEHYLVSSAIITVFAWLVPHLGIEVAEYRLSLAQSPMWTGPQLQKGMKAVTRHALIAIAVGFAAIAATATAVGLTTQNLDSRMVSILSGLSRLMASVVMFFLSYKIPKWLGVYHSVGGEFGKPIGKSVTVLSFNVRWSLFGHLFTSYFYLLPFYCGVHPGTIPLSAMLGMIAGYVVSLGVYYGRTKFKAQKFYFAMVFALGLALLSSIALANGCYFIQTVWGHEEGDEWMLTYVTFFVWLFIQLVVHFWLWKQSKKAFQDMEKRQSLRSRGIATKYHTALFDPNLLEKIRQEEEEDVDQNRVTVIDVMTPIKESTERDDEPPDVTPSSVPETLKDDDNEVDGASNGIRNTSAVVELDPEAVDDNQISSANNVDETKEERAPPLGEDDDPDPSYWVLLRSRLCGWCCCNRGKWKRNDYDVIPVLRPCERAIRILQRIFNALLILAFLYLTVVNIGASTQVQAVNQQLNQTFELLYPANYNNGTVCAFDNNGPASNITTFPSPLSANSSGFEVLHCGACGACSSWQNLEANWKTRSNLAALSQACAKKLLFGGYNAAIQCHLDTIGFDETCSKCWVEDEMCARNNCVFIYLQALMINNVGNFKVGPGTITSATCDESMCGPVFVPCSGATRRRMNIVSDIARPENQQCRNVQVNWTELYGP